MTDAAANGAASASPTFCPQQRRKFVLFSAILASAMGFIDGSVVSIAIPAIRADLGASLADGQWISNGYMLFLGSLILLGGAAGDTYGLRRVFSFGIALLGVASLVCAIAPDAAFLIVARGSTGDRRGADGARFARHHRQGLSRQ